MGGEGSERAWCRRPSRRAPVVSAPTRSCCDMSARRGWCLTWFPLPSPFVCASSLHVSSMERYTREVESGLLRWSTVHSTEFWRENVRRFEVDNFKIIKQLSQVRWCPPLPSWLAALGVCPQ